MISFKRHGKLWQKFIANCSVVGVSNQRLVIKFFKALWFLIAWPFELLGDLLIWPPAIKNVPIRPKILIIKIDQLGDVLFSTFLLPIIKEAYPDSQLDYLINPNSEAVIKSNPAISQVYYWRDLFLQNIPGRQKLNLTVKLKKVIRSWQENYYSWQQLLQQNYDVIINARAFWPSSNWPWFKLGQRLVAFDFSQASCLANYQADYDLRAEEWQNYLNLLRPLAISSAIIKKHQPRGQFFNFVPLPQRPVSFYWCLSPVSFDPEKTWTQADWVSFIQEFLAVQPDYSLVLTGLPDQKDWFQPIMNHFSSQPRVSCLTNLSIPQLAELLKNSQGFIGLESFTAHLAIALEKPVFCLVNSQLFYVPGLSKVKLIDGRSMLPQLSNVIIRDLLTIRPKQLVQDIFAKKKNFPINKNVIIASSSRLATVDHNETYGRHLLDRLVRQLKIEKCVDLGCGGGSDLSIVKRHHSEAELFGVDSNLFNVDKLKALGIKAEVVNIETDKLPFSDESVDLIIANQVLEHIKEIFWINHEIFRCLKVGGIFFMGVPNVLSLHNRILMLLGYHPTCNKLTSAHVRVFSKKDVIAFYRQIGNSFCQVEQFYGSQFYPFPKRIARFLSRAFPTMAVASFYVIRKTDQYGSEFINWPEYAKLETNYFTGKTIS